MHRECPCHSAVPRLSLLAMRHEGRPVALNEGTDVLVPAVEATLPSTSIGYEVVHSEMSHMHPARAYQEGERGVSGG